MKNADRMTAKERIKCLILGKPIDRVPFIPFFVGYLAISNGISLYDFFSDPELAFQAGIETSKAYPWTNTRPVYDWSDHGAWEFGGKIGWPKSNVTMTPFTPEPLLSRPDEIDLLPDPDPLKTEWYQLLDHFNQICSKNGFSALLPSASIMSPLSSILGSTNLLKWIIEHPNAVHQLAEKVLNFYMRAAEITLETYGARNCSVTTLVPLESNSVISKKTFKQFCLPYIERFHRFYFDAGVRATMIHLCGDHRENLTYWKELPLPDRTIFSIGNEMDLKLTGDLLGERFIVAGNISTTTIQLGTKEEVKEEVQRCLFQAKDRRGGFILMPACEWPPMAPRESLEAVKEALTERGFY